MAEILTVDAPTLKEWLEKNEVILIDVRELDEYKNGYIQGAVLHPLSEITPHIIPQNPDKKIVFQCRVGGRSEKACILMSDYHPDGVFYNFVGGFNAWEEAGYSVQRVA